MSYGGGYGSRGGDYNGYSNGYVFSLHLPTSLCRDFQEFHTVCDHFDCRGCAIVTYFQTLLTKSTGMAAVNPTVTADPTAIAMATAAPTASLVVAVVIKCPTWAQA